MPIPQPNETLLEQIERLTEVTEGHAVIINQHTSDIDLHRQEFKDFREKENAWRNDFLKTHQVLIDCHRENTRAVTQLTLTTEHQAERMEGVLSVWSTGVTAVEVGTKVGGAMKRLISFFIFMGAAWVILRNWIYLAIVEADEAITVAGDAVMKWFNN